MIISTAWKNVWRNKVRSLVVILSVTIGIFGGAFAVAVMNGAINQRVEAALDNEISHIQVNSPGFRDNNDITLTFENSDQLEQEVRAIPGVESVTRRLIIGAMANTASKSTGVQVVGIDPVTEMQTFRLYEKTLPGTGSFFRDDNRENLAYIGEDLAKELNIIRFVVTEASLDSLREEGIPEEVIGQIAPYAGVRFSTQKSFTNAMKKAIGPKASARYGQIITAEAWSFRSRSKLTLTFLDKNNIQTGAMFRIAGIYDLKNNMYEMGNVFVLATDLQRLAGLSPGDAHMMLARLSDREQTQEITEKIAEKFPGLEVINWKQIAPDLAMMTDMVTMIYVFFMGLILAALAFGIVNTMLMVVLERTKELGMLTAIGMNKRRVFSMIMTESVFLSLVGGFVGMFISWILIDLTSRNGINLSQYAEGFEALGFSAHIYPEIDAYFFVLVTILIIITGILSSVYPALKALRLDPADALRTE